MSQESSLATAYEFYQAEKPVVRATIHNLDGTLYEVANSAANSIETISKYFSQASPVTDSLPVNANEEVMGDISREEFDAKLATAEARTETRFVELSGKIDRVADSILSLSATVKGELEQVKTELSTVKTDNKFTRLTITVAIIGSVIAGLAALWVTQSNLLASFSAGLAIHDLAFTPRPPLN